MNDTFEDDFDSVGFASDDFDAEECEKGSGFVSHPGKYHFEISNVQLESGTEDEGDKKGKTPAVKFTLTVLHSTKGQSPAGSILVSRLYFSEKEGARKNVVKAGLRLGLLIKRDGKAIDPATGTGRITPTLFKRALGLQCVAEVRDEPYNGKPQFKIPFSEFWSPFAEEVKDVPKSQEHLALISGNRQSVPTKSTTVVAGEYDDL